MASIPKSTFSFLKKLMKNNNRDWMTAHKQEYLASEKALKEVYKEIQAGLNSTDEIEKLKVFRIHRDVRFSKNKTPYNVHRSANFSRLGAHRRGSYYLRIEPNGHSLVGGGFYGPEPKDLKRIRQEFQMDAQAIRSIIKEPSFCKVYGNEFVQRDAVKTAPRGFDKNDENIDLIRLKSFFFLKTFTDEEVMAPDFVQKVVAQYQLLRPFFDYMSEVLTTDLNGESLLD